MSRCCACHKKCPELKLEKIQIDWKQEEGNAKAKFKLVDCPKNKYHCLRVYKLKYVALTNQNSQMMNNTEEHREQIKVVIKNNCEFEFDIPLWTVELKVHLFVDLHENCCVEVSFTDKQWDEFGNGMLRYLEGSDLQEAMCVVNWNRAAIDAIGLDHVNPVKPDEPFQDRLPLQQAGPCRSARSLAIVHLAVYDAAVSIKGKYEHYYAIDNAVAGASFEAAIATAAYKTLIALYPSHQSRLQPFYQYHMSKIANGDAKSNGVAAGQRAADAVIADRITNNADGAGTFADEPSYADWKAVNNPNDEVGVWQNDPISAPGGGKALGANWAASVSAFVLPDNWRDVFLVNAPPALNSHAFALAFLEPAVLGGDGVNTATVRSEEFTFIGNYYAYDGTPSLCAPPRMYNLVALQILQDQSQKALEILRGLALLNVAMADAGLASWYWKWHWKHWRPVTGIRRADECDNNEITQDATWAPLGAPASNVANGVNFTPPFPALPSGHATFGGSLAQILRHLFERDNISFTFVSEEYDGVTKDNEGNVRELKPRAFANISQFEEENGQSRMYLGIHWNYDKTEGIKLGRQVADYVFENYFRLLE